MPKIGMCKSGGWHLILVAAAAFFAMSVIEPVIISAATAHAQSGVIRDIQVTGNRRVEPETVRSYLKFNVGDVYEHRPGRTITENDNIQFSLITMNAHPMHCDKHFAANSEFGQMR